MIILSEHYYTSILYLESILKEIFTQIPYLKSILKEISTTEARKPNSYRDTFQLLQLLENGAHWVNDAVISSQAHQIQNYFL